MSLCECFIDNKSSIHFGDDKTKAIVFSQSKSPQKLNISNWDYSIKRHNTVEYVGCYLDSDINGESMDSRVLRKINTKLNLLWKQRKYLNYSSRRLPCNALIQQRFGYGCLSRYALRSKVMITNLQIVQNKCERFCLEPLLLFHINPSHFSKIN